MKLTRLSIQNFMAIEAFEAELKDGAVVVLEAKNGVGKTSALKAIQALFAGGKAVPDVPVRKGAKKAEIIGETETLVCKRTFTSKGTKLEVRPTEKGAVKMTSPQKVLDELIGSFLDPIEFDLMPADKQARALCKMVGLDLSTFDVGRKQYETERRDVGRDKKRAEGALAKLPPAPKGDAGLSVSEILEEIKAREERNDDRNSQRAKLAALRADAQETVDNSQKVDNEISEAIKTVDALQEKREELKLAIAAMRLDGTELAAKVGQLPPDEPVDDLRAKLKDAEAASQRAAEAGRRSELESEVETLGDQYENLTSKIEQLDAEKDKAIQGARYPIDGLEAHEDGVYLDGVPWSQACASRRIKASAAIGFRAHPELKIVCIQNASLLDDDSRRAIYEIAEAEGGQAFLEIVGAGDEVSVVIEDGEVSK